MKKLGILIIGMAMMSTIGLAQTDTTYHEDQYEESQDYGKDQNYNEDQSSDEDRIYDRSYDENPAREEQTWKKDTTDQYGSGNRSFENDTTDQYKQDRSYDSNEGGMNENRSYATDTTQGTYGNRSYETDPTNQGMYGNRSYETDTVGQDRYGNRSYENDTSYQRTEGNRSWKNDTSAFTGELSEDAKEFIKTAAESSRLEMYLAQVALQKDEISDEIVRYGQNLVEDHAEANRELSDIASNFQVEVPALTNIETDISNEHQGLINDLRDMEGDEFHESFINRMVEEHQSLIDEFEKAKDNIDNQELSRWIDNTLPALKDHLNTAQTLQSQSKDDALQDEDEGLFEEDR